MKDNDKTQAQLIKELAQLRERLAELEATGHKRNRFEETLRLERDKAKHYLDIAEVILIALNKKGEITLINRKGNQILGYKEGELLGKNWFTTCVPSHRRKQLKSRFLELMAGKIKLTEFYEDPALTKAGTERIMAWHNSLLNDAQGNNIGTLSSGEDITERKQAEKEIERLSFFPKLNPMPIVEFDQKGQLTYANPAAEQLFPDLDKKQGKHPFLAELKPYFSELREKRKQYIVREVRVGDSWYSQVIVLLDPEHIRIYSADITERKRAEEALRESEERYHVLFEEARDGIALADADTGILLDCNRALADLIGRNRAELIGQHQAILHPPSGNNTGISSTFKKHLTNKEGQVLETQVLTMTGEIREVEIKANLLDLQGRKVLQGLFHDITERKQAEEKLRESETRFRTLFEAIPDTVLVHDDEGTILHINEIGAHRLEWSAQDLVGKNLRAIVSPENRALIADHIRETHKIGWCRFETTYVSRSGWQIVAEVNERPIKYGKKKAILSVARDITERKQAEKALVGEKNFSNAVINSSPGLLFVFGEKGNIIQWNSNAEKVTGYSSQEISKMNVLEFVAKDDIKIAAEAVQEALTQGQASVEIDVLTKSGKKTPFYIIGLRTKIENANCVVCTGMDVTERKQAEAEVKRSYEQLHETFISTVNALASIVEMKDQYTAGHQPRVTQLACAIAEEMGLSEEQIEGIRMAASIHDIGKIIVPAEILNKPGALTEIQYEMIKMHPRAGYDILKGIKFPWPVAELVLQHHELMDGSGYPQGLSGDEIMVEARILMVANVVEAMTSHRPYRPAFDIKEALAEIAQKKGILYDPIVADACVKLFAEKAFAFFQRRNAL
ncbi:MAG: hypothetical protein A2Z08_08285 [Deltaproteobacteria bacterium RBG_16_54_11]|nr:MAG: hypothetical protein A2Z08_08285 [Deltaproteobacteria bacterium RBG_16_54_11]